MSVRRFAVYFFALAACSTIAFASGLTGKVAVHNNSAALESDAERPLTPSEQAALAHRHSLNKLAQIARAD